MGVSLVPVLSSVLWHDTGASGHLTSCLCG